MHYLRTLGELSLSRTETDGAAGALNHAKPLVILAMLATTPAHQLRRDYLAELLWPSGDRPRALRALRQALFQLTRAAGDVITRDEETVALVRDRIQTDLWEFDAALTAGDFGKAVALHRGRFLQGLQRKAGPELEHWIEAENSRLEAGLELAYARHVANLSKAGNHAEAVRIARAWVEMNPLDDERQQLLVRTLIAAGDEIGAVRAYEAYRTLVARELEDEPPKKLQQSIQQMRAELFRPDNAPAPPPPEVTDRPAAPWYANRRHLTAILGGATLLIGLASVPVARRDVARAGPLYETNRRLLVTTRPGASAEVMVLALRGTEATLQPADGLAPGDLPSPDGRLVAFVERSPDGMNLAVRDDEERRTLSRDPHDEYPVAWAPDGRRLIYAFRRILPNGRGYGYRLAVFDLEAGVAGPLTDQESPDPPGAEWSPDGARIAYTTSEGGAPEVFVADADGGGIQNVSNHQAADRDPAWSPDGERLAFVSERGGAPDIYTARPDGSELRQLTRTGAALEGLVWLSPALLAFVVRRGEAGDVWLLDTFNGEARAVTSTGTVTGIEAVPDQSRRWIDRIAIRTLPDVLSPGQSLDLEVTAITAAGDTVPPGALHLDWTVTPDHVARVDDGNRLRILEPGGARVVASAGGWRADTVLLAAVAVTRVAVPSLFAEDWSEGIAEETWRIFGQPSPVARPTGGLDGRGVFVNRGDEFFQSGAVTRTAFPLNGGLTVEVLGRMRFTGKLHQVWGIALYQEPYSDSVLASGEAVPLVEFLVQGPAGPDPGQAWVATPEHRHALPMPRNARFWRRYALQVLPDGGVDVLADGGILWRSPYRLPREKLKPVYLGLGFQSYQTEIGQGSLMVYGAPKYRLPSLNER